MVSEKRSQLQNPLVYIKISQALAGLGEPKLALEVCERGLTKYPDDHHLHMYMGNLLTAEYKKVKNEELLSKALANYEDSLKIQPSNYQSALMATRIYFTRKAYSKAKEKLDLILSFQPGDLRAKEMIRQIEEHEAGVRKAKEEKSQLLFDSEGSDQGDARDAQEEETEPAVSFDVLIAKLTHFAGIAGVLKLVLMDPFGMVLKSVEKSAGGKGKETAGVAGMDVTQLALSMSGVFRTSVDMFRRSALGKFNRSVVMLPDGRIYLVGIGQSALLAIVTTEDADHTLITKRINAYIEESRE